MLAVQAHQVLQAKSESGLNVKSEDKMVTNNLPVSGFGYCWVYVEDIGGRKHRINVEHITRVSELKAVGKGCEIYTIDRNSIETSETFDDVFANIRKALSNAPR